MYARRVDTNDDGTSLQADIASGLRAVGCHVVALHAVGHGCPDLSVSHARYGHNVWLEVKGPAGKVSPAQREWHAACHGPVFVVRSLDDALTVLGLEVNRGN